MNRIQSTALFLLAIGLLAVTGLNYRKPIEDFYQRWTMRWGAWGTQGSTTAEAFPQGILRNEDDRAYRLFEDLLEDKVVVIQFMFTSCPRACPLATARLRKVYQQLGDQVGKDVHFYSISIDPKTDQPRQLKDYKERFQIGRGWNFFTGDQRIIDELQDRLEALAVTDGPAKRLNHAGSIVIGSQTKGLWLKRKDDESPATLAQLIKDLAS